ncbi:MAG: alcohol dehydrogenase catalytic domain-containing protein [SAR202 cluster bacterium]|jgi:D-arabinose 1-dehydrogenase-like Zn-dependent alcohol dehydrogenase|nr:alcohol dehydrogenase catalytic domain-containing protein [SAR202 cluster bacterium]
MRAMLLDEPGGPLRSAEVDIPSPGPGEALLKVRSAGVGLTLAHIREARGPRVKFPRIIGHEIAGGIVEVGSGVTALSKGERCLVHFYLNCWNCKWCRIGRETLCSNLRGNVGTVVDGGFAEYVALPYQNFIPIPDELDYEAAAVTADAICTPWHVMKSRTHVKPMDDVLIIGAAGGVGIHAVQMAKLFGARVIAVDISEEKLAFCRQYGADEVINGRAQDIVEEVSRLTDGKGVEVCADFFGSPQTAEAGINALSTAGTFVIVGVEPGTFPFNISRLLREQVITGNRYCSYEEMREVIRVVARGLVKPVVTKRVALEDVEEVFDTLSRQTLLGRAAISFD